MSHSPAPHPSHETHDSHEHHESHSGTYFAVFIGLCVLTGVSVLADQLHFSNKAVLRTIILAVATSKALCVMLYFMHLKFESAWKYLLLAPTFILAASLPFALAPDVGMHYYTSEAVQIKEYERIQASGGHGSASQGHGAGSHSTPAAHADAHAADDSTSAPSDAKSPAAPEESK